MGRQVIGSAGEPVAGRRVFVTGGASGLGRALAERYAREGFAVAIGDLHEARGAEALAALHALGADARFLRCDVTVEEDLAGAARTLEEVWGGVDVVVNNAGVAVGGGIAEVPLEDWRWIVDVNLLGVVRGCKAFTPLFRRQGGGRFVNVASMAGLIHPPRMAAYNATKAAVVALSETLRVELAADGIAVSVVCPGFFRTNLAESLRAADDHARLVTERLVGRAARSAAEVADAVYDGVARGDFLVLTHADGAFAFLLKRLAPFRLYEAFLSRSTRFLLGPEPAAPAARPRPGPPTPSGR